MINTMVFKEFGKRMYGMSSAYGVVMFIITAVFGLIALKLTNKDFDS